MNYNIPFIFEKNIGQCIEKTKFLLKQKQYITFFKSSRIEFYFVNNTVNKSEQRYEEYILDMVLEGSNKNYLIIGKDRFKCNLNYLKGNNKENWVSNVPIYEKIKYRDIYKDIDLIFYENNKKLEHDFLIKPNGSVSSIKISFKHADNICLDENNNLIIKINKNNLKILKPKAYQYINDDKIYINCDFIISNKTISFKIDSYDKSKSLIIDPILEYSSYLGGNGNSGNESTTGEAIAVDEKQCVYITGKTNATANFPITYNGYKSIMEDTLSDTYLIKIDTTKSGKESLIYASYIGGDDGEEYGYDIKVLQNRYAYIVGQTSSTDFPITLDGYKTRKSSNIDAFLIKLDTEALSASESLIYSTYLGGEGSNDAYGLQIDSSGKIYIVGSTTSNSFNVTNTACQSTLQGQRNAFFIKLDITKASEDVLLYGTYLGGNNKTIANSIALDNENNVYIVGQTTSTTDFPLTQKTYNNVAMGDNNGYIIKINPSLNGIDSLIYGSYIGGSADDIANSVDVDINNYVYIVGETKSKNFPTTPTAYANELQGSTDIFIVKMDLTKPDKEVLLYGTYIGGNTTSYGVLKSIAYSVIADYGQCIYVLGSTTVSDFPVTKDALQENIKGRDSIFFIKIDTTLENKSSLVYGTYLGGDGTDIGYDMVIDNNSYIYITGQTSSAKNFPLTDNAYQNILLSGFGMAFLIKLNLKDMYITTLKLKKYSCKPKIAVGEKLYFKLELKNQGDYNADNVIVTDKIDSAFDVVSFKASKGEINNNENLLTWTISKVLAKDNLLAFVEVLVNGSVFDTFVLNEATLVSDTKISNVDLIRDSELVYIEKAKDDNCDLVVEISSYKNEDNSQEIIYRIDLVNNGPSNAINVLAIDTSQSAINIVSYKSLVGTITYSGSTLNWAIPTLKVKEKVTASIVATYSETDFLINTVNVTSDTKIVNLTSCTDTVIDYVNYSRI